MAELTSMKEKKKNIKNLPDEGISSMLPYPAIFFPVKGKLLKFRSHLLAKYPRIFLTSMS